MIYATKGLGGSEDFGLLVHELGQPFVLKHLGISRQQLAAWLRPDSRVPRGQVLALYWESEVGRSVVDSHREFEARNLKTWLDCCRRDIEKLQRRVLELETELRSAHDRCYSANDGWFSVAPPLEGIHPTP